VAIIATLPPNAGSAPQYLGLSWRHACYREHHDGFTTSAGDCPSEPEQVGPIGVLNYGFTPRSRVS